MYTARKIDDDTMDILRRSISAGGLLYLPAGLTRDAYVKVNKVLGALGGIWSRSAKAHVFSRGDAAHYLAKVLTAEVPVIPNANPHAYFATPDDVLDTLMALACIPRNARSEFRILEPSAGEGAIAMRLREAAQSAALDVCEIDPERYKTLERNLWGFARFFNRDFLGLETATFRGVEQLYDRIVMNPPFSIVGNRSVYVDHINKAWSMLKPGGRLVSIAPASLTGSTEDKVAALFRLAGAHGDIDNLPSGSFKTSGTAVETVWIVLDKPRFPVKLPTPASLPGTTRKPATPRKVKVVTAADVPNRPADFDGVVYANPRVVVTLSAPPVPDATTPVVTPAGDGPDWTALAKRWNRGELFSVILRETGLSDGVASRKMREAGVVFPKRGEKRVILAS